VDPLAEIVPVARRYGAWVHVDAAMAGSALLLPEMRWLVDGVEGADSLSWNPHKWMGTVLDCSLLYVADPAHLIRVMSTNPSYLRSAVDGEVTQYKDWGIPLGRRFRALKLWFHLRLDGVEAIRARLRRDLDNARWLAEQVASTPGWRVLAPVNLQTVVLRHEPARLVSDDGAVLDADALNEHTLAWVDSVNASGAALVTPSLLDGTWSVRISIGAERTEREDVAELWSLVRQAAELPGHRGVPVAPGRGLFELAGDPDQQVLPAVGRDQLDADRQAARCPVQGQADGGLAGHVELRGVGDEAGDPPALLLGAGLGEPAKLGRWRAQRRRQQQVMVLPPAGHPAGPLPEPGPGVQVGHRVERPAGPAVVGVARFDLVLADRAADQLLEAPQGCFGVDGDDHVEAAGELPLEHGLGRGGVDVVAERLQQPRGAGRRGAALRIVEIDL
jgi:hypothetical protein